LQLTQILDQITGAKAIKLFFVITNRMMQM